MTVLQNQAGVGATAGAPTPSRASHWRGRLAILTGCALVGVGCATASRQEPSPRAMTAETPITAALTDPAGPPAVTPSLRAMTPSADRAAWSGHSKAGREHLKLREYREAEEQFIVAMALAKGYGPTTQRQHTSLVNLERVAQKYDASSRDRIRLTRLLLPIAVELRGPSDISVARHSAALGEALAATSQFAEARELLEHAMAIFRVQRGDGTREIAKVHVQLARLERKAGNLDAAEAELRSALAIGEQIGGPEDPKLAPTLVALAKVLGEIGRTPEAEAELLHASQLVASEGGLAEAMTLMELARFYTETGRLAEAEELALRALVLAKGQAPPRSQTLGLLDTLGAALLGQEKYEDAEEHLARAYELTLHHTSPTGDRIREHYAQLLRATRREGEALAVEAGRKPMASAPVPAAPSPPAETAASQEANAETEAATEAGTQPDAEGLTKGAGRSLGLTLEGADTVATGGDEPAN